MCFSFLERVLAPTTITTTSSSLACSRSHTRCRKYKVEHTSTTSTKIIWLLFLNLSGRFQVQQNVYESATLASLKIISLE